ncbi:MAG TPA: T9SS type A sorting domain-containing protein [Puia sp.]|nr:T9SS type A sorting domain-containing protein [Puia sp.]
MKSRSIINLYCLIVSVACLPFPAQAQTVANWNFNNTLAGTGSANSTALNASLGSAIGSGAYNGGTVYYGEGGWPSGAADPNAFLEFTVNPTSAHSLTVASMVLSIRRSTTGSTGSGPNNWSLRSSVDGFAADISNGPLTTSIVSIPVSFGAAYANLSVGVTFRLYGYNAAVSSGGGLNRFVFDNISISGSSGLLPVVFESFKTAAVASQALLSWTVEGVSQGSKMQVERSGDGKVFDLIGQVSVNNNSDNYQYTDYPANASGVYFYRIALISADGQLSYSPVKTVSFVTAESFEIRSVSSSGSSDIRLQLSVADAGNYGLAIYDMNGVPLASTQITLYSGAQVVSLQHPRTHTGIYIINVMHKGQQRVVKLALY